MSFKQTLMQNIEPIIAGAGLLTLVATTCLKDNVHFGSVTLKNPQRNQYTYGFFPIVDVKGNSSGNFYTVGLLGANNYFESNSTHNGNSVAAGLGWGYNFNDINSTNNGNSSAFGLLGANNYFESNSVHNGSSTAAGLVAGINCSMGNSTHNGNSSSYGLLAVDSEGGHFLSHSIIENSPKTNLERKVEGEERK